METQISDKGRKLFERIKKEHRKILAMKKRVERLLKLIHARGKQIDRRVAQMSNEDLQIYREQFERMSKQLTYEDKDIYAKAKT